MTTNNPIITYLIIFNHNEHSYQHNLRESLLKNLNTSTKCNYIHNEIRIIHHSNYTFTNYEQRKHRVSFESLMNIVRAGVQAFKSYLTLKFYLNTKKVMLASFLELSFIIKVSSSLVLYHLRSLFKFTQIIKT